MYHQPVLLSECIKGLNIKPEGCYADVTFGGGGHSRAIMEQLGTGHLYAFDQDEDAAANVIDIFAKGGVNVAYMYSFLLKGKGILILRTHPSDKAHELMILNKVSFITEEDLK